MLLQKWRKWKLFYGAMPCTLNHRIKFCGAWWYHWLLSDTSSTLALTYRRIIWEEANVLRLGNGLKEWVSELFCCFAEGFRKTTWNVWILPFFWNIACRHEALRSRLSEGRCRLHLHVSTGVSAYIPLEGLCWRSVISQIVSAAFFGLIQEWVEVEYY
jgi:hypothetical protein